MSANDARHTVSRLAQLVERVTSNDEVSRSSRLVGNIFSLREVSDSPVRASNARGRRPTSAV